MDKNDHELFEALQSDKTIGQPEEKGQAGHVESLAQSLRSPDETGTGSRAFSMRYDAALLILAVVLVMMVVSYVLGVAAGKRLERAERAEVPLTAMANESVWVVQVMSGSTVSQQVTDRYIEAKTALEEQGFFDVAVHKGTQNIYLTVGRFSERDDRELGRLAVRLEGLELRENSVLTQCRIVPLADLIGSL